MINLLNEIILKNISKSFDGKPVLKDFSLIIPIGSTVCVKGASGSGKTTLLKIIASLIQPDSGTMAGVPEKIAFVFQEDRLCEDFSAISNVRLVTGGKMKKDEILSHLNELGLSENAKKPVKEFSGGMKRRVSIARAICYDADLILLDEPFKGLDEKLKKEVMDYVKRHTVGKTVILVTHDDDEADHFGGMTVSVEPL